VNLYNTVSSKALKLDVFSRIVAFAADTRQVDALAPYLASAATWQARWGLTPAEAGALFLLVARALERTGHADGAQTFLIRHLATFEGVEPAAARAGARAAAKAAAINFVRAPAVSQRSNLASMAAVRAPRGGRAEAEGGGGGERGARAWGWRLPPGRRLAPLCRTALRRAAPRRDAPAVSGRALRARGRCACQ